jgi:two-component system, sensor histidine kinase and response regulator
MRILIAEDDADFRNLLQTMLVRWGYEVVATRDGKEAWQVLQGPDAPRLAVLDWMMPGMEGVELCRKVRQELPHPYSYLILLTSQQLEENVVAGMEAGADDYITKPLNLNQLRVRLNAGKRIVELQDQLLDAQEKLTAHANELEMANRDLEDFSFAIANDVLRSLLSIGDYSKSIQDLYCGQQDEQCRFYTHRIYQKTKALGQLIGVMRDFFRPSRTELRRESVDLSAVAAEAAEGVKRLAPQRQVFFRIAQGVTGNGDRNLLRSVIHNLFDNALKHTRGSVEPMIEFGARVLDGKTTFFVRDNGVGFDMAEAARLFRPFQRLPGTDEYAGRGIGLATVERSVRRHGGKVWAEGEKGKGATFFFTLD